MNMNIGKIQNNNLLKIIKKFKNNNEYELECRFVNNENNNKNDLLSSPWENNKTLNDDYVLSQKILDNYAKKLSRYLNNFHNKNFPDRYWNILTLP